MPTSTLVKTVTRANDVVFQRKSQTSIKTEATPGEQIDQRTSSQRDFPPTEDEKAEKPFLIPGRQQVLNCPNKSMLIAELRKNHAQKRTEHVEYDRVSHDDSEIHAEQTATWNDVKFQRSRIVCDTKDAQDTRDQAKHFAAVVVCCKTSPKSSRSKQSNESTVDPSRTSLAFMTKHWKNTQKARRYGKSEESHKLKRAKDYLDSARKHHCGTIVERDHNDEQYPKAHA